MRRTRMGALLMALILLVGTFRMDVRAAACESGSHIPGELKGKANYTVCGGGYQVDVYTCSVCGTECNEAGESRTGGFFVPPSKQTHSVEGEESHPADYTECFGGYQEVYYICTVCGCAADAQGNYVQKMKGKHTPTGELHQGGATDSCRGYYEKDYYLCEKCSTPCDEKGKTVEWVKGEGKHFRGILQRANYTECGGGYKEDFYRCAECYAPLDADGNAISVTYYSGDGVSHKFVDFYPADYTECGGGYTVDRKKCACGKIFHMDGTPSDYATDYKQGNGQHHPGEVRPPSVIPCVGGYLIETASCTVCGFVCNPDGSAIDWDAEGVYAMPTEKHTPGAEKYPASYNTCTGGFDVDYYRCAVCNIVCDAEGNDGHSIMLMGIGWHQPELIPAKEPDYTAEGCKEHYECVGCGKAFSKAEGILENMISREEYIIPALVQVDSSSNTIKVTDGAIDKAIEESVAAETPEAKTKVVLPLKDTQVQKVELPANALQKIADSDKAVTIETDQLTASIDSNALAAIIEEAAAKTTDGSVPVIAVEIKKEESDVLSDTQKEAVKDREVEGVISAEILCNGQNISSFNGGKIRLRVPFTAPEGMQGSDFEIIYVADAGYTEQIATEYEDECLVVDLEHLSDYAIVKKKSDPEPISMQAVYRLYNPNSGEHLYTTDANETRTLSTIGWTYEGTAWSAPQTGVGVYRLYSPVTKMHLYTSDVNEVNTLVAGTAWQLDNDGNPLFYTCEDNMEGKIAIYRLYNEAAQMHLLTTDLNEYNILGSKGWNQEGEKLSCLALGDPNAPLP